MPKPSPALRFALLLACLAVLSTAPPLDALNAIVEATATSYNVTTTSGTALAENQGRKDAAICNSGSVAAYLRRGSPAIAGSGIYLAPNGGCYNIDQNNYYSGIITAITASGTTTLSISEGR